MTVTAHDKAETELFQAQKACHEWDLSRAQHGWDFHCAADVEHRIYHFSGGVHAVSVAECYEHISRWARMDISEPVEIQLTTPGGSAWDGMALFDQLQALRDKGLFIRIVVRGTAASMGAILLQVADERVMGPRSTLMLHKLQGEVDGSLDQIEDRTTWFKITQTQVNTIFEERTGKSARTVAGWLNRKDSSFGPQAALEAGLIDRIG